MKTPLDWIWFVWWAPTVLICIWKLVEGVVRPARMLEWPFIACGMWLYFFGYMAFEAVQNLPEYLGNGMSEIGQLMALLCLVGLLAGWSLGKRTRIRPSSEIQAYPYFIAWLAGSAFLSLGAVGGYSVAQAQDEGSLNYHAASAYWYLLFYVGYPGLTVALWSLLKMKTPLRFILWGITIVGIAAFMYPHIMNARRGPLFPAIIVLLLVPPLTLRRPPNRFIYLGGLAAAAITMLLFLQVRTFIYGGDSWNSALQNLSLSSAVVDRAEDADDNEYVNNCQTIGTIYKNGKYLYGSGHLEMLIHWIPRALWRNKPPIGEGIYSYDEMYDDIEANTGVRLLGNGAAATGVADSFAEYGVFCPLFWFGLSYAFGVIYAKAIRRNSPWWMFIYVGFICAANWLISQNFTAALVPAMYFESVPLAIFVLLSLYNRLTAAPHRYRRRSAPAFVRSREATS